MIQAMQSAISGLMAQEMRLAVTANNLANLSTPGFQPSRVALAEAGGQGGDRVSIGQGVQVQAIAPGGAAAPAQDAAAVSPPEVSQVDPAAEMVNLIQAQRAFEANLKILKTSGEMLGLMVDRQA